jgi:hypothetical protein
VSLESSNVLPGATAQQKNEAFTQLPHTPSGFSRPGNSFIVAEVARTSKDTPPESPSKDARSLIESASLALSRFLIV